MIKKGYPRDGEFVIAEIASVNPNSVIVKLKEYDAQGMIHISEVSRGWIKDIRNFVKVGQEIVAKVIRSDHGLSLSIKRVSDDEKNRKIKSYRFEIRAVKLLEMAGDSIGATQEQKKEILEIILERFGSIYEVFKIGINKPEKLKKNIPEKWADSIIDVAKKNITKKDIDLKARLFLQSSEPNGINIIKDVLKKAEKMSLKVTYISAPEYLIKFTTKDPKKSIDEFEKKLQKIASSANGKYEIIE